MSSYAWFRIARSLHVLGNDNLVLMCGHGFPENGLRHNEQWFVEQMTSEDVAPSLRSSERILHDIPSNRWEHKTQKNDRP